MTEIRVILKIGDSFTVHFVRNGNELHFWRSDGLTGRLSYDCSAKITNDADWALEVEQYIHAYFGYLTHMGWANEDTLTMAMSRVRYIALALITPYRAIIKIPNLIEREWLT